MSALSGWFTIHHLSFIIANSEQSHCVGGGYGGDLLCAHPFELGYKVSDEWDVR